MTFEIDTDNLENDDFKLTAEGDDLLLEHKPSGNTVTVDEDMSVADILGDIGSVQNRTSGLSEDGSEATLELLNTEEIQNSDYNESVEVHSGASGTVTLDLSVANVHHVEATGDVTLEFSNVTGDTGNSLLVYLADDDASGPHTISWPASVVWSDGDTVAEIPAGGDVEVSLLSGDGSEWRGRESGRQFA